MYDYVIYDSALERKFAAALDNHDHVEMFVKLPRWFKIDTPVGAYNPDWALVTKRKRRLYLVRETKGSIDDEKRRKEENDKISCSRRHFDAIDVDFDVTTDIHHMLDAILAN